jgi:Fur family ferric uptake transcriptional regulator
MSITVENYLKERKLSSTAHRKAILEKFMQGNVALSHTDLEQTLAEEIDRVTIYRSLNTFVGKGVLHKIVDHDGITKYALCKDNCQEDNHQHNHIHFKCVQCEEVVCLENVAIPVVKLPSNYVVHETNLMVSGVCDRCR